MTGKGEVTGHRPRCECGKIIFNTTAEAYTALVNFREDNRPAPIRYYECTISNVRDRYHLTSQHRNDFNPNVLMVELQRAQMADSYKVSFIKKFLAKQPNKRATARDIVEAFEKENPRTSGSSIPTALSNLSNMGILFKYKSPIKGSLIEYTLAETEAIPFASIPEQKEEEPKMATIPVPSPPVAKLVNEMENTIVSIDSRVNAILNTMHSVEDSVAHAQGIWKQGFTEGMREGIKLGMELAK